MAGTLSRALHSDTPETPTATPAPTAIPEPTPTAAQPAATPEPTPSPKVESTPAPAPPQPVRAGWDARTVRDAQIIYPESVARISAGTIVPVFNISGNEVSVEYQGKTGKVLIIQLEAVERSPAPPKPSADAAEKIREVRAQQAATRKAVAQKAREESARAAQVRDATELHLIVRSISGQGILAERLTLQRIPGSSGSDTAGGFVRYPQSYQPSGQYLVLLGYSQQAQIAEGDALTVRATHEGVQQFEDITGTSRSLHAWRAVE